MKNLLMLMLLTTSVPTLSAPLIESAPLSFLRNGNSYIEYKRSEKINPHSPHSEYLRAGYKYENVYAEVGKDSSEVGYKWSPSKNFIIKGKIERVSGQAKLETEIRYTFK